jgi:hypothetical protein
MPRKPFAVEIIDRGKETEYVLVVCDDGSAMVFSWRDRTWSHIAPIPGTLADTRAETTKKTASRAKRREH